MKDVYGSGKENRQNPLGWRRFPRILLSGKQMNRGLFCCFKNDFREKGVNM